MEEIFYKIGIQKVVRKMEIVNSKKSNFMESTKTNSSTSNSGATSLPPVGDSFMYIETSGNNNGDNVFCSFQRTDIIQISKKAYSFNRFSSSDSNLRALGKFRSQLLLEDKTCSTRYNIPKNDRYSGSPTDWTLVNINFTIENYGVRIIYDEIDSAPADICFSNITITYSVYKNTHNIVRIL